MRADAWYSFLPFSVEADEKVEAKKKKKLWDKADKQTRL